MKWQKKYYVLQSKRQSVPSSVSGRLFFPKTIRPVSSAAIIDRLNISEIVSGYKGCGISSYNSRILQKVVLYAYLNNVYSCWKMERLIVFRRK